MAEPEVKVSGLEELKKAVIGLAKRITSVQGAALYLEGNNIMTLAKEKTPVDTGTLRASGFVTEPKHHVLNVTVSLGFGGPAEAYAIVQHEHTEYHHEVGEAKFLTNAIAEFSHRFQKDLAAISQALMQQSVGGKIVLLPPGGHPTNPWEGNA